MITFTDELHNHLVDFAARRAAQTGLNKKKAIQEQHTIFVAATTTIDLLNGQIGIPNGKSCVTPNVWVDILRGNLITKIEKEATDGEEKS